VPSTKEKVDSDSLSSDDLILMCAPHLWYTLSSVISTLIMPHTL
jgi:hypothetical protein